MSLRVVLYHRRSNTSYITRDRLSLPDGGEFRFEKDDGSKVRIFLPDYGMDDYVVAVPDDINKGVEDSTDPSENVLSALNEMLHSEHAACPFCRELTHFDDLRRYGFAGTICMTCWEDCPDCGQCDEWKHNSTRSTRKPDKKKCENCGKTLITKPATG